MLLQRQTDPRRSPGCRLTAVRPIGLIAITLFVLWLAPSAARASHAGPLSGQWHFDDTAGCCATGDSSGHGRQAASHSDLRIDVHGRFGNALSATNSAALSLTGIRPARVTLLAWLRAGQQPPAAYQHIAGSASCEHTAFALVTGSLTGRAALTFRVGEHEVSHDGRPVWDGDWHMVAGVFDGTRVRLYVDGRESGAGTPAPDGSIPHGTGERFFVDGHECKGENFTGGIDELRVYDRALSASELQRLAAATGPEPPVLIPDATPAEPAPVPSAAAAEPAGEPAAVPYVATRAVATVAGVDRRRVLLDASGSVPAFAVAREFAWNLDADPAPEAICGPETPRLETSVRSGARRARLVVTDARGTVSKASVAMPLADAPRPAHDRRLAAIQRRIGRAEPMATCRPAAGSVRADVTAHGGPPAGCISKTQAREGLVSAVGCLYRVASWSEVPRAERGVLVSGLTAGLRAPAGIASSAQVHPIVRAMLADEAMAELVTERLWVSDGPVRINGLDYTPAAGAAIVIVAPGLLDREQPYVLSSRAEITVPAGLPVPVRVRRAGQLALAIDKAGVAIGSEALDAGVPFIPGTRIAGKLHATLERERSRLSFKLQLPDVFRLASGGPVTIDATMLATNHGGVSLDGFQVANIAAQFHGVGIHIRYLRYSSSARRFAGDATVALGPVGRIDGTLHVRGNAIELLELAYFPGAPGIKVGPGVFLSEIFAAYENRPGATRFGGGAAFTGGPSVGSGCGLVGVRGGFDLRIEPPPLTLTVEGTGSIMCIPLFRARATIAADGYVAVGAGIHYGLGPLSLSAGFDVRYYDLRFTAEAHAEGCVRGLGCLGGQFLISDRGLAFCARLGFLRVGAGLDWPPSPSLPAILARIDVMFSSCSVGKWRTVPARAAQAGRASIQAREDGVVVGIFGAEHAPPIRLHSPEGDTLDVPENGPLHRDGLVAFRQPDTRATFVAVRDPGRWTYEVLDDSPVVAVREAPVLSEPSVRATVSGTGKRRQLRYKIAGPDGQIVRFFERSRSGMRELGSVRGNNGVLRFAPAETGGATRTIVAAVEQEGRPRAQFDVARFTAAPPRIGRVGRLRVRRAGATLTISFRPATNATRHLVGVQLSDGRSLDLRATRRVRVHRVARGARVRVRITGTRGARRGPMTTAILRR